jgi:hypothetical protein
MIFTTAPNNQTDDIPIVLSLAIYFLQKLILVAS